MAIPRVRTKNKTEVSLKIHGRRENGILKRNFQKVRKPGKKEQKWDKQKQTGRWWM